MFSSQRLRQRPADRVRRLWQAFEQGLFEPRAQMERQCKEKSEEEDKKRRSLPAKSRRSEADHQAHKSSLCREIEEDYFTAAREEWQKRLEDAGLRDEDWDDMTQAEAEVVERALGAHLVDEEDIVVVDNLVPSPQPYATQQTQLSAPTISSGTRSTNISSSYAFVNPQEFGSDDEPPFGVAFAMKMAQPAAQHVSDDEDLGIPAALSGKGWGAESSGYTTSWSTDSFNLSAHSSNSGSPEHRPKPFGNEDQSPLPPKSTTIVRVPLKKPSDSSTLAPAKSHAPGSSYIGPHLNDSEESLNDAAEFEKFKMDTRIKMILEFHQEAAKADIDLALDIYNSRKTKNSTKADDIARVAMHEQQMLKIREEKESKRKEIVAAERKTRLEEIRRRNASHPKTRSANVSNSSASASSSSSTLQTKFQGSQLQLDSSVFDFSQVIRGDVDPRIYASEGMFNPTQSTSSFSFQESHRPRRQSVGKDNTSSSSPQKSSLPKSPTRTVQPSWAFTDQESSEEQESGDDDEEDVEIPDEIKEAFLQADNLGLSEQWRSFSRSMESKGKVSPPLSSPWADSGLGGDSKAPVQTTPTTNAWTAKSPPQTTPTTSAWAKKATTPAPVASTWGRKTSANVEQKPPSPPAPLLKKPISPPTQLRSSPPAEIIKQDVKATASSKSSVPTLDTPSSSKTTPLAKTEKEKPTPAPAPPPPSSNKKQTKKQKQVAGKKGNSTKAEVVSPPSPPPPAPAPTTVDNSPKITTAPTKRQQALAEIEEEDAFSSDTLSTPTAPSAFFRKRSQTVTATQSQQQSPFGTWDEVSSTPRPSMSRKPESASSFRVGGEPPRPSALRNQIQINAMEEHKQHSSNDDAGPHAPGMSTQSNSMGGEIWMPGAPKSWNDKTIEEDMWSPPSQQQQQQQDRDIWVPPGVQARQIWNPAPSSSSMTKSTSLPVPAVPSHLLNQHQHHPNQQYQQGQRSRGMSDPVSPSPRGFVTELPDITNRVDALPVVSSANTKKGKGKRNNNNNTNTKAKPVTVEVVSDEEGSSGRKGRHEKLPSDSKIILEPKPSVPPTMFSHIFQYDEEGEEEKRRAQREKPREGEMRRGMGYGQFESSFSGAGASAVQEHDQQWGPEWFAAAARELQNGTAQWEKTLSGSGGEPKNMAANVNVNAGSKHVRWTPGAAGTTSGVQHQGGKPTFNSGPLGGGAASLLRPIEEDVSTHVPGAFSRSRPTPQQQHQQHQYQSQQQQPTRGARPDIGMGSQFATVNFGGGAHAGNGVNLGGGDRNKGKERTASDFEGEDELTRLARGAIGSLMSGKPAPGGKLF